MALKNVQIVKKGERPQFMGKAVFEYASDITVFNVYDQDWKTLQAEGLSYLFNDDQAEFKKRKEVAKWKETTKEPTEEIEPSEKEDERNL